MKNSIFKNREYKKMTILTVPSRMMFIENNPRAKIAKINEQALEINEG